MPLRTIVQKMIQTSFPHVFRRYRQIVTACLLGHGLMFVNAAKMASISETAVDQFYMNYQRRHVSLKSVSYCLRITGERQL